MKLYRRMKRSTKQYVMVAIICIVVIGTAAVFASSIMVGQFKNEYREQISLFHREMKINQQNVYIAVKDIKAGDIITSTTVKKEDVYSSQPRDNWISQKEIGMAALIDIPAGTQLLQSMLTAASVCDELREVEYQVININANIKENDTVDVRICYPNGESYVVLSKKILRGYVTDTATCYFWNSEEEVLRMSAAIVDANLYEGAKLITTKYIEPRIQGASLVTYTPNIQVLSLMASDPNIVVRCSQELNKTVRKSLENRLADTLGKDISSVKWDVPDYEFQYHSKEDKEDMHGNEPDANSEILPTKVPSISEPPKELGSFNSTEDAELGEAQEAYMYYAKEGDLKYGE